MNLLKLNKLTIVFSFKFFLCFLAFFWIKREQFTKLIKLIIPQIIMVSGFIIFSVSKIRSKNKSIKNLLNLDSNNKSNNTFFNANDNNNQQNINIQMTNLESTV